MEWREKITTNPKILRGRPAIKGTRLSVSFILELMAAGADEKAILDNYPQLSSADIRACLSYASASLEPPITTEIDAWIENPNIPLPAQAMLSQADVKFRACELGAGSGLVWQAVAWAVKDIAARRGWAAATDDDLESVIARLDNETGERHNLTGGFLNALALRHNTDGRHLLLDEIGYYVQLMPPFLEGIFQAASEGAGRPKIPAGSAMIDRAVAPDEVRIMLSQANVRFNHNDPREGSRLLWQAVEWSIRDVAAPRGWPAGDIDELEQAIERLENESSTDGADFNLIGGFLNALAVKDNADGKWLCESDAEFFAQLMPPFIESIFAAARSTQPV